MGPWRSTLSAASRIGHHFRNTAPRQLLDTSYHVPQVLLQGLGESDWRRAL